MKRFFLFFLSLFLLNIVAYAQNTSYYLAGAVPVKNGIVTFEKQIAVPGKTQQRLFETLKQYVQQQFIDKPDRLQSTRITELSANIGLIVVSVQEPIVFTKNAWVWDEATLKYQLLLQAEDEKVSVIMRQLRYDYAPLKSNEADNNLRAEDWITDQEALNKKKTKLIGVGGKKLRVKTIERKDLLFLDIEKICKEEN